MMFLAIIFPHQQLGMLQYKIFMSCVMKKYVTAYGMTCV